MIAEIIAIGTEILLGDIIDTNSSRVARMLTTMGFDIHNISVTGDNCKKLRSAIEQALTRADIIITTGGLGPTDDDITREAVAEATGCPLQLKPELVNRLQEYFRERGYTLTDNNLKQANLPLGADVIYNKWGTAPGFILNTEQGKLISLPGVPNEMKKMLKHKVKPILQSLQQRTIKSRVLNLSGIGESTLEEKIKDILDEQSNPTIALLAGKGEVKIRITASGNNDLLIDKLINHTEERIRQRVGRYIYGINEETLAQVIGKVLRKNKKTLGLAESCTGGLVADRITDVAGSSDYFKGGVVAYNNQVKNKILNVAPETINERGAVSAETVKEMVTGVRKILRCDIGIAISGIAGPGGGSRKKPVGLVYIAIQDDKETDVHRLELNGSRTEIKWKTAQYALFSVLKKFTGRQK